MTFSIIGSYGAFRHEPEKLTATVQWRSGAVVNKSDRETEELPALGFSAITVMGVGIGVAVG